MAARGEARALRSGYTTGACAAAAAKAATIALLKQVRVENVEITIPTGQTVPFVIKHCTFEASEASCSVIKDAGDDPDITDGAEIQVTVRWQEDLGISVRSGEGVGLVTKPGLEVPVGMPAINPVPRRMIEQAVDEGLSEFLERIKGVVVTVSVAEGERLAKQTLNPRLGIIGGISILGTTGVVIPYSVDAYTACISQSLEVVKACGHREVVLTTGRRSEKFAQKTLGLPEDCFVLAGDFIDYSLEVCAQKGLGRVIIWGMIGKMTKLAAGHLYTNVSDSKVEIGHLTALAKDCGVPEDKLQILGEAVTANHFRRLMPTEYMADFCNGLCSLAARACAESVSGKVEVECVVTDSVGVILGRSSEKI